MQQNLQQHTPRDYLQTTGFEPIQENAHDEMGGIQGMEESMNFEDMD